jgi:hypothetical protein
VGLSLESRLVGADVLKRTEGSSGALREWAGAALPPGSKSRACTPRSPKEPGRPVRLHDKKPVGEAGEQPWPVRDGRPTRAGAKDGWRWYLLREGNEAGREGRPGFGASNSTDEAGEPASSGTLWREGDAVTRNCWRDRCRRHWAPKHLHETQADSEKGEERNRGTKSRMRELRTSGSVGGPGPVSARVYPTILPTSVPGVTDPG